MSRKTLEQSASEERHFEWMHMLGKASFVQGLIVVQQTL